MSIPPNKNKTDVVLTEADREELERRVRSSTIAVRDSIRAKIVLLRDKNYSFTEIQRQMSVSRQTVIKWTRRYNEHGLDGLQEAPGRGRKPWISPEITEAIITGATQPPKGKTRWSTKWFIKQFP